MSDKDTKTAGVEFLLESARQFGVAVSSVSDGYVLVFKREAMQKIIDEHPDHEMLTILVQTPKFQN